MLTIMPHCTETDRSLCRSFAIADPTHLTTDALKAGDILDIDVVIQGQSFADVRSVRAWMDYDPTVLEARNVEMSMALPSPTPGEQTIDANLKVIKIGGTTNVGVLSANAPIARVTFRVITATANTTLSFHDYQADGTGHTYVNGQSSAPLLYSEPTKLTVALDSGLGSTQSSSSVSNAMSSSTQSSAISSSSSSVSSSSSSTASIGTSAFSLLQVQNVRVTSKDSMIFLGWQPLKSSELSGYNVYYGTVSGRYLQRRSVAGTSTSLVLRDLEPGTPYYLAVRAVNANEQESAFSQEVSVTVGKPETATAPLTNIPKDMQPPTGNPITQTHGNVIQGETGMENIFLWVILGSAVLGTLLAFRRQFLLSHVTR